MAFSKIRFRSIDRHDFFKLGISFTAIKFENMQFAMQFNGV